MFLTQRNKIAVLILALSPLIGGASSCQHAPPIWKGKLWAADSEFENPDGSKGAIRRAQDAQAISCRDASFNSYICMSYDDFRSFYDTYVLGCKSWTQKPASAQALWEMINRERLFEILEKGEK